MLLLTSAFTSFEVGPEDRPGRRYLWWYEYGDRSI